MADTIRDFLVSLGWKVDEQGQDRFIKALRGAEIQAKLLADALEALARKAAEAIADVAQTFDRLYFSAQRTGATAATIRDFGYAVKQLGGSAESAEASLEAMGQKLRENPGNIAYLNALGFGLNKINGHLEVQADKLAKFQQMPMAVAELYRQSIGLDERTFLAMRDPQLLQNMNEAADARKRFGFDPDKAAVDANAFMTTWRRVGNDIGVIADDLFTKLMKALDGPFQEFKKFIEANGPAIKDSINTITTAVGEMAKAWVDSFEELIQNPDRMAKFQNGMHVLAEDIAAMAKAMGEFARYVGDIKWFFDKIGEIAPGPGMLWNGMKPYSPYLGGDGKPVTGDAPAGGGGQPQSWWEWGKSKASGALGAAKSALGLGPANAAIAPSSPNGAGGAAPGATAATAGKSAYSSYYKPDQQSRIFRLMDRLVSVHGWTPEAAAIAAGNAVQESNVLGNGPAGDGGISQGMFQWNHRRLSALQSFGGAQWKDPDVQADFMAQEAERMVPGWKGVKDLNSAGSIGHRYEGYDDNSEGARVRDAQEALAAYNARNRAGGGGVTRSQNGEYVNGNWVGKGSNTDPRIWKPNGGGMVDWADLPPEYRGGTPSGKGFDAVQKDAAEGDAWLKAQEAKKNPWGALTNPFGNPAPIGGDTSGDKNVSVHQHNTFHIDGANDPSIVAHMVGSNMNRTTQEITRNLTGATN